MDHPILAENQNLRLTVRIPLLVCFAMYAAWQMGVVYFSGTSLSLDGRTPLPVSVDNMTAVIAAGYVLGISLMALLPRFTVMIERVAGGVALLSVLALYIPLPPEILANLFYLQSFCCVFMIVFEAGIITNLFTEETAVKHLLVGYAFANIIVAVLQNDIVPVPFPVFRLLTVVALVLLLFFFFTLPAHVWPRYAKKNDGLVKPRQFFAGIYILIILDCFMTLFGGAVAESIPHGVSVYYFFLALYSLVVYLLWRRFNVSPLRTVSVLAAMGALGFVAAIFSLYIPALGHVACALIAGGMTLLCLNPFFCILLANRYPSRFITPINIGIAFATVLVQSVLLEAFRSNLQVLYIVYLAIAVALTIVYLMLEPYLIYSFRRRPMVAAETGVEAETNVDARNKSLQDPQHAEKGLDLQPFAFDSLSGQEIRLAELIMQGYGNAEMAEILHITGNTVKGYRKTLYSKLQIHSRRELFALAEESHNRNETGARP